MLAASRTTGLSLRSTTHASRAIADASPFPNTSASTSASATTLGTCVKTPTAAAHASRPTLLAAART